jgi:hypothetical protein
MYRSSRVIAENVVVITCGGGMTRECGRLLPLIFPANYLAPGDI